MIAVRDSFGDLLKHWRRTRRLSQLELAVEAGVSQKHLSFMESGRSGPSREMVLALAEELDVPLRERNDLLRIQRTLCGRWPLDDVHGQLKRSTPTAAHSQCTPIHKCELEFLHDYPKSRGQKSLALHRALAAKLTADPTLLVKPRARLEWLRERNPASSKYYDAWSALIRDPLSSLISVMTSDSPQSCALRQESPFFDIVDQKERAKIYRETAASIDGKSGT